MQRYRWAIVLVFACVVAAGGWTAARGDDDPPLTAEEKAELAAQRKEEWRNRQMFALWSCVAAVAFVSLLFWALTHFNKVRKQRAELERQQALPPEDIHIPSYLSPQPTAQPLDLSQPAPLPLKPPPSDW